LLLEVYLSPIKNASFLLLYYLPVKFHKFKYSKITFNKLHMKTKKKDRFLQSAIYDGFNENFMFLGAKTMHINTTASICG